ncbi:hypothetical protein PIB30_089971 [Stylosanthes scabra]|uniref:CCHC-type domain-containing protein n=1 Tax=Stylosanthes scabra TaxID=79078 RepID=A0ABU6YRR9_9FABA|nr:hypothetical protein [Stylosanthes scabra]
MTILESQGGENKNKSLALKASNSHVEESDEEEVDQDFAILIKKFTKFAKRENMIPKKQNIPSKCFECGEIGHIKPNCPKLQKGEKNKKFKKKQKAYMSWENEDDSSTDSNDDEVENICLMANDEKKCAYFRRIFRRIFPSFVSSDFPSDFPSDPCMEIFDEHVCVRLGYPTENSTLKFGANANFVGGNVSVGFCVG